MNNRLSDALELTDTHPTSTASQRNKLACFLGFVLALAPALQAELKLPAIIGDHMVLQ